LDYVLVRHPGSSELSAIVVVLLGFSAIRSALTNDGAPSDLVQKAKATIQKRPYLDEVQQKRGHSSAARAWTFTFLTGAARFMRARARHGGALRGESEY
jgi:hypothetical protein